jgi:hypothetical protein
MAMIPPQPKGRERERCAVEEEEACWEDIGNAAGYITAGEGFGSGRARNDSGTTTLAPQYEQRIVVALPSTVSGAPQVGQSNVLISAMVYPQF